MHILHLHIWSWLPSLFHLDHYTRFQIVLLIFILLVPSNPFPAMQITKYKYDHKSFLVTLLFPFPHHPTWLTPLWQLFSAHLMKSKGPFFGPTNEPKRSFQNKRHVVLVNSAAAAAKSRQSCPTLYDPIDGSPPGSSVPGILQARILEWVAIFFSNAWKWKVKVKSLSRVRLLVTPWTAAYQAPLSMDSPGKNTGVGCH